ncbi:hypothetical protein, partial [Klebsiella pneumoniae]|uniref:hypothetical protein n=1 Tax=Klebsiella pneumoniae TaxID=573 RepID=UPI0021094A15
IQWLQDGVEIEGATNPSLTVSEEGSYTIEVNFIGTTCVGSDSIIVEVYDPVQPGEANDLFQCSALPTAEFDLTDNEASILADLGSGYFLSYY